LFGFFAKLFVCPAILLLSYAIVPGMNFYHIYQSVAVGIVIALAAHLSDLLILRKNTFWISNTVDLAGTFIIIYISQYFLRVTAISFLAALFTAILLTVAEYFLHSYLIRKGMVQSIG